MILSAYINNDKETVSYTFIYLSLKFLIIIKEKYT